MARPRAFRVTAEQRRRVAAYLAGDLVDELEAKLEEVIEEVLPESVEEIWDDVLTGDQHDHPDYEDKYDHLVNHSLEVTVPNIVNKIRKTLRGVVTDYRRAIKKKRSTKGGA